ncbi:uncharacterized protein LOC116346576 [Contarinia nasturtii]|uniref:uncharacterized protein LOC116346576 n=1 Tax=Contarinia nasturtii TaxID=265458 RepID=UPI0012D3E9E8|nr:uncharacterized protein LOC116346576 [Contarinia nasturtii]
MKLIGISCIICLTLVSASKKISRRSTISVKMSNFLPSRMLSGKFQMINADNIHPANIHEAVNTNKGSAWMFNCCGREGDFRKIVEEISLSDAGYIREGDILVVITYASDMFKRISSLINSNAYGANFFSQDLLELNSYANDLKNLTGRVQPYTKNMIEKMCVDMYTNMCLMKASQGPNAPIILPIPGAMH